MPGIKFVPSKTSNRITAITGIEVSSVLCPSLFRDLAGLPREAPTGVISAACHDRWTNFANVLGAAPEPVEVLLVVSGGGRAEPESTDAPGTAIFAIGRGDDRAAAGRASQEAFHTLRPLVSTTLDYVDFDEVENLPRIAALLRCTDAPHVLEVRRRVERFSVVRDRRVLGFGRKEIAFRPEVPFPDPFDEPLGEELNLLHLFPWVPSDDPWHRLLQVLDAEEEATSVVVHARGLAHAPEAARVASRSALATAAAILREDSGREDGGDGVLRAEVEVLEREILMRLVALGGRLVAARVFISGRKPPSSALVATLLDSIDDASTSRHPLEEPIPMLGGARVDVAQATDILAPLDDPSVQILFSPREASAVLRTAMPSTLDLPGLTVSRARTSRFQGIPGGDAPLGANVHRGERRDVSMSESARFRHAYVVGQTGTGKSTLLQHMILHDVRAGRGVCVIDPHGPLLDAILRQVPPARARDVVLVDVTDVERPIGFNILKIDEADPREYRRARDLLIDDLYGHIDRTYDLLKAGGPIFETHFRAMLGLLLGGERPPAGSAPSLMLFRSLYTRRPVRERLRARAEAADPVLAEFLQEALAAKGEAELANVAPYITSKFTRFVSDAALRNMTCQDSMLDFPAIVEGRKILLVYVGKGRFGEHAAGLLASRVVAGVRDAVLRRRNDHDAAPFYLYADEFQLVADERFAELLAEARKFGLALTLAHQFVEQLPDAVLRAILGNIGTIVSLRVGPRDAETLAPYFRPVFDEGDLSSLANFQAIVRSSESLGGVPFSLRIPPPDYGDPETARTIRRISRETYGRRREEVEEEILRNYRAFGETAAT